MRAKSPGLHGPSAHAEDGPRAEALAPKLKLWGLGLGFRGLGFLEFWGFREFRVLRFGV